jgi:hypothetical protein
MSEAILRGVWGQRTDGQWAVQGLKSVPLSARTGDDAEFFPVKNDVIVVQPNYVNSVLSMLGESIVPVVAYEPSTGVFRSIGTGFFVSCTGLLITAAHVVTDPIERRYGEVQSSDDITWSAKDLVLGVMVSHNAAFHGEGYTFCQIEWASFLAERRESPLPIAGIDLRITSDIAICKVERFAGNAGHQPLTIVQPGLRGTGVKTGCVSTAIGYVGMTDETLLPEGLWRATAKDFNFDLHVSKGEIGERFPDNHLTKSASTPGPCFSVAARYPGGMSGSPIFDQEGIYVHGVVSRGLVDERGVAKLGYGSMIAPSLHLPIKQLDGRSLVDLMQDGGEGISRISLPGG